MPGSGPNAVKPAGTAIDAAMEAHRDELNRPCRAHKVLRLELYGLRRQGQLAPRPQ